LLLFRPVSLLSLLVTLTASQPNEIVIELNEKLAKLQLTISKQAETIQKLEKEKKELELTISNKCQGQVKQVDGGKPSNYPNPLWPNSADSNWVIKSGIGCLGGKGAVLIKQDPFSNSLSLQECQDACQQDSKCAGIVRKSSDNNGKGICIKRKTLQVGKCAKDATWNLHEKPTGQILTTKPPARSTTQPPTVLKSGKQLKSNSWEKLSSLDCYAGRGGDPIQPDPYSNSISLRDCKAACDADYNCQGVIRKSSDGQGSGVCYKRRNIVRSNCVRDPLWELHQKPSRGSSSATARPPSNSYGCKYGVQSYPRNLPNAHFYTRLCTTNNNLKIVSSSRPTNAALERTAFLIGNVMANVDQRVAQSMNARGFRHAVMAAYPAEVTTHIPEHAWLGAYWNERARGLGATVATPVGSSAEENALCHSNDRYRVEDITIHEFAHSMHLLGFALVFPTFNSELTGLYNAARYGNFWGTGATGTYAMTDFKEYFAEGVQSYFDTNAPDSYAPTTRDQLWRKDPNLYHFLNRYLGNNPWKRSC